MSVKEAIARGRKKLWPMARGAAVDDVISIPPLTTPAAPVQKGAGIRPGHWARDMLSGLEGLVIERREYLHGCTRIAIQAPGLTSDGKPFEEQLFDEQRVEIVRQDQPAVSPEGPQPNLPQPAILRG